MDEPNYGLPGEARDYLDEEFPRITERCSPLKFESRGLDPNAKALTLFHYTSAEATRKILTCGSLRATNAQFLSDRTEFHYGIDLARKLLKKLAIGPKEAFLRPAGELLGAWLKEPASELYIISFSSDGGNRLGQWMIYGEGGTGVSIGFDYKGLTSHFRDVAQVQIVTYDPNIHERILTAEIEEYWRVCDGSVGTWPDFRREIEEYCRCSLVAHLVAECAAFKHPGYEDEREFRLVARRLPGCPEPRFRAGRFGITPYLVLESPDGRRLPIKRVTQGPTADRHSAEKGLKMLLADLKYEGVEIEVSDIPQR